MRRGRALLNRWVLVPAVVAVATLGWNLYVAAHDDGIVEGIVVGPRGRPVTGAEVVLLEQNVTTFSEQARTRTGPGGLFRFNGNRTHHAQVFAEKDGHRSDRATLRLWFRSQNTELTKPLVLRP
jgi:hypothetical protein